MCHLLTRRAITRRRRARFRWSKGGAAGRQLKKFENCIAATAKSVNVLQLYELD